ncbi:MAG: T9SS type A sorting domain-containing protein, partial [candidate division KSB1 bacterium]|nr:T9SS type A sorting domain-containing protein [candidate division KSB1 bacterium]
DIDADCNSATGLTWGYMRTGVDYYLDFSHPYAENSPIKWQLWKFAGQNNSDWKFEPMGVGCNIAFNLDDNKAEFAIPRAAIGETAGEYESTAFFVYVCTWADPWPSDHWPNDLGAERYVYRYGRKQITIDGDMSDWSPATHFDVAPNEVEGAADSVDSNYDGVKDHVIHPALDVTDIYVAHDDQYLYIRLDINENGTFSDLASLVEGGYQAALELFIDTDEDTSTGLTWGWWYTSGDYWVNLSIPHGWPGFELKQKYGIMKFIGLNGMDSRWEEVMGDSCILATNSDDNKLEVAIPRAAIGEDLGGENESTAILVLCEDPTMGWVNDAAPNSLGTIRNVYNYGRPIGELTSVKPHAVRQHPASLALWQNYPNPFNPETSINFSLNKAQWVTISIFNAAGQKITTLHQGQLPEGSHQVIWDGKNSKGENVSSGIYFYNLKSKDASITKKMLLIR